MSNEQVNTVKLGLFVTVSVALFVFAVYLIGNDQNLFQSNFQLRAVFQNAEGLKRGNNVRYAGIDAGTVKNILITSDSTVEVVMVLQRDMQQYIKKDAIASIGSDGLVGNKIVNISPATGNGTASLVDDQDLIRSYSRIATDDMLEVLGKTNENIALFSLQLLKISEKINKGSGTMNMLIQDPDLATDLRQSIINLKHTTGALRVLGTEMAGLVSGIREEDGLLHTLLFDTTLMSDIHGLSGKVNFLLTDRVEPLLKELEGSAANLSTSTQSLASLLEGVENGNGVVGSLLQDSLLERDLERTLVNIQESSERFKENMEAMRHNFLFRPYFKKLEKKERKSLRK